VSLRAVAGLAAALAVVTGTAFAVQAHDRREAGAGPGALSRQRYVAAELRTAVPPTRADELGRAGATRPPPRWVTATARATGIPGPAVRAYAGAQLAGAGGCGIGWTTLAGIGWVESQHGTIGGRSVRADGRSSTPVLGPALDGRGRFAAIRATPGSTAWHGDRTWEHAVGPMQFLPGTWAAWASDGDRDGRRNPLDLDDAAVATARYLCAGGHDVDSGSGWAAAVLTYNHDRAYVDSVYAAATAYARETGRGR
jgi:transglycosylase-like protein with SLT domain